VCVGGTAGRLPKLGERERCAQFEAARCLLPRDGDGGPEGFLGREAGGVELQQNFAADAMQFRFERAMARAVERRQRFVEDGDGAIGIARLGFSLGQRWGELSEGSMSKPSLRRKTVSTSSIRRAIASRG
jgi:hypothetical protein